MAAAAMSIVRLDVEALALERLGAMVYVRSLLRVGKKEQEEEEICRRRGK